MDNYTVHLKAEGKDGEKVETKVEVESASSEKEAKKEAFERLSEVDYWEFEFQYIS